MARVTRPMIACVGGALSSLLMLIASSSPTLAATEPDPSAAEGRCRTPREALFTVLYWLQPERIDRNKAAACLDRTGLPDPEVDAARRAAALKLHLDQSGAWVAWEDIPDEVDFEDSQGEHRFEVYPDKVKDLTLVKVRGRWLVSPQTLAAVAPLVAEPDGPAAASSGLAESMPDWLRGDVFGVEAWQLLFLALLVILGVILRKLVIHIIVTWVRRVTKRLALGWVDQVAARADKPVGTLVVAAVLAVGVPILALPAQLEFVLQLATRSLAAYSVVWLCYRLVDVISDVMEERAARTTSKLDDQLVPIIRKSLKVFFVVVGAIFILQNLDVDVGSLLAGLGLGGLAFALAAKDTVANFFGSVMIFVDKPFQIGDWVKMPGDIEGTVEEVGFRTSRIRTFYNSVITVPNANVTNTPIDNLGARRYRRYRTMLGLTYDTPPEKIEAFCEGLRAIILATPGMRKDYFMVEFQDFGPCSLDILLYCFFEVPDWTTELRTRTHLNLSILRLAKALGVSFAFPTQTLHLESTPGRPLPTHEAPDAETLRRLAADFGPDGGTAVRQGLGIAGRFEPLPKAQDAPSPEPDAAAPG